MKKITNLEMGSIVYFLIRAYFIGLTFNVLLTTSKQDNWLCIILGIIFGFIPLLIFFYIFNYEPDLNLNEKNIKLFGKIFGNIINILLASFTFFLIITIFSNLITFIHSDYLSRTPTILIGITFLIAIFYSVYKGVNAISRSCLMLFYISLILVLISNIGLLSQIDINNFKPILFSKTNLINGTYSYIAYNVLPLYLINIIPKNKIKNNNKTIKTIIIFYLIAALTLFLVVFNIIGIFGVKLARLYQYPEFQILKHVSLVGLSARLDSILFIQWIFDLLIFVIVGLYYIISTTHIFIKEKKNICLIIYSAILMLFSELITNNIFINLISLKFLPHVISITTVIIFLLIYFKIKYTNKVKNWYYNCNKQSNYYHNNHVLFFITFF